MIVLWVMGLWVELLFLGGESCSFGAMRFAGLGWVGVGCCHGDVVRKVWKEDVNRREDWGYGKA